ncbi:MAG: hypothetical protein ACUVUG_02825 [Candidatus Aminicenantia bacterium]
MSFGLNNDIYYKGVNLHIQTELKGSQPPCVETLIYKKGEIIHVKKTDLQEKDKEAIRKFIEKQHKDTILSIKKGMIDSILWPYGEPSLDELIIDFLKELPEKGLKIFLFPFSIIPSKPPRMKIYLQTRESVSSSPVSFSKIKISIKDTSNLYVLWEGFTDKEGRAEAEIEVPQNLENRFFVVINAEKEHFGYDEIRKLMHKV